MSKKILLNLIHPNFERSRANKALFNAVADLPITPRNLVAEYKDGRIDADKEHELISLHDLIIFQHPIQWYSAPPFYQRYIEEVLSFNWAYPVGRGGDALAGKQFMNAVTAGGNEEAYRAGGSNNFSMSEMLHPQQQTALYCGMKYLPSFVVYGTFPVKFGGISDAELAEKAKKYRQLLSDLLAQ